MTGIVQKSLHGIKAFIDPYNYLFGRSAIATGGRNKPQVVLPGSSDTVAVWEDFLGDFTGFGAVDTGLAAPSATATTTQVLDTGTAGPYFYAKTGDTGMTGGLIAGTNGIYRITSTATAATTTADAASRGIVGKQAAWKANQGPGAQSGHLRFGVSIRLTDTGTTPNGMGGIYVGWTDSGGHELPIYDTGRTGDSGASAVVVASDLCGFLWGTNGDTGWRGVARKSTAGDSGAQQVTLTTTKFTANKWQDLEVEINRGISDTGGTATFFVDGTPQGTIVSPVATTTALYPCIYYHDTGGADNLDIDWVNPSGPRDTGS